MGIIENILVAWKVNQRTQELMQSDPHQALATKGKDRQMQLKSHERTDDKQSWQPFTKTVTQTIHTYINKRETFLSETLQNIKQNVPRRKYRFGTVSKKLLEMWVGGGGGSDGVV